MSNLMIAFLLKLVMIFVLAAASFLVVRGNALAGAVAVGIAVTAADIIWDLYIAPRLTNLLASAGEGALAISIAYVVDLIIPSFRTGVYTLAAFGVMVAVGEYFFHLFLKRRERIIP